MEQLNQFLDELEKEEGIKVEVEETSQELADVLASQCVRCGHKCGGCAQCKAPENFEDEKIAA